MKTLRFCLIWLGFFAGFIQANAQCANDNTLNTTISPTGAGFSQIVALPGGTFVVVNVCAGATYVFSTCSNTAFDTQITMYDASGNYLAYNDDGCGLQSTITWLAPFSGAVNVLVDRFSCTTSPGNTSLTIQQTTACGTSLPPANDPCSGAIPISCGQSINGTTINASSEAVDAICGSAATPSVWYTTTGNGQIITASLCGSSYDTRVEVYTGSCGALSCLGSNEDFCGIQSQYSFASSPSTIYYIRVTGFSSTSSGAFTLSLTCTAPPLNDNCTGAITVSCGQSITGNSALGTPETVPVGCGNTTAPSLWYQFAGNGQILTASLCNSTYDTQLQIFTGNCGALSCAGTSDDYCGVQSQLQQSTQVGTTYYIRVSGFSTSAGNFQLDLSCASPPANDPCSGAIPIVCGSTISGNTSAASPDLIPAGCGVYTTEGTLWYSIVGTGSPMTASTCGLFYNTQISVYTGGCNSLTCVNTNDNACGLQSVVTWTSTPGTTYYMMVGGSGESGNFTMNLTCNAPPSNTDCSSASQLCADTQFGSSGFGTGNVVDLTATNEGCLASGERQTIWYYFQPTTVGQIIFNVNPTPPVDYDFAIWGPMSALSCPPSAPPIRCSYSGIYGGTGLSTTAADITEGAAGDSYVSPITVTAADLNKFYLMALDNFTISYTPFVFDWQNQGVVLACALVLPIDLLSFSGINLGATNRLSWSTAAEQAGRHFIIEKSADNEVFQFCTKVLMQSTALPQHEYQWIDEQPYSGVNYYRLGIADQSNQVHYSQTIAIEYARTFHLYPNPGNGIFQFHSNDQEHIETVRIFNSLGQIVTSLFHVGNASNTTLDLSFLNDGVYQIRGEDNQGSIIFIDKVLISKSD